MTEASVTGQGNVGSPQSGRFYTASKVAPQILIESALAQSIVLCGGSFILPRAEKEGTT